METITFVDWEESDFRYTEERARVAAVIRRLATERDFSHAKVQYVDGLAPISTIYISI